MPARDIARWIRAQSHPYPGAFTMHDDERLTIWRAQADERHYLGRPGEVVRLGRGQLGVICGDEHPLLIEESSAALRPGWRLPSFA
jgi:methionyl-tRNA formyltransferase